MFRVCFIDGAVSFPSTLAQYSTHVLGQEKCGGVIVVDWGLGGVVDHRSPHQKRAATHAYDRSGTAAFSWVCGGGSVATAHCAEVGPEGWVSWHRTPIGCAVCVPRIQDVKGGRVLVSHGPWGSGRPQGRTTKKTTKCRPLRWGGG